MKKKVISGVVISTIFATSLLAEDFKCIGYEDCVSKLSGNAVTMDKKVKKIAPKTQVQLDMLSKDTLISDPAIDFQKFQVENSKLDLETQEAGWLPTVDFTGSYAQESIQNRNSEVNTNWGATDYKIEVKQLIYDFKINHSINKSELDLQRSNLALQQKEQEILYRGIASYFNVVKAYRQMLNSQKVQKSVGEQVIAEQKKIKNGAGSKTDLLQAQAVYQNTLAISNTSRTSLLNAINMYTRNFKTQPVNISKMTLPTIPYGKLPKNLEEATKIALENNPSLIMDEIDLKKLAYDQKIDQSKFYPKLELSGTAQQKDDVGGTEDKKEEYILKATVTYNLYNGGKDSISMKKNKLNRLQQKSKIKDMQNAHKQKVAYAWQNHIMKKTNHEYTKKQVKYYKEYLEKITQQWKLGKATMFNVLDAETKYHQSMSGEVAADIDKQVSVYGVLVELGKLELGDIMMPKESVKK